MNHVYRTVWNEVSRTFVAVAENVRRRAKSSKAAPEGVDGAATGSDGQAGRAARAPGLVRGALRPMALEPRFMFDGAAIATGLEAAHAMPDATAHALVAKAPAAVEVHAADPALNNGRKEVAFVDTAVGNYQALEAGIRAGVEIVEIDGSGSGLAQIARWAQTHAGYDAIHILSHGSEGLLHLGRDQLSVANLGQATVQAGLAQLGQALAADGDLMLYGCSVAHGATGQAFVAALAAATGADVAASQDATGAEAFGGDWVLESQSGSVWSPAVLDAASAAGFGRLLAVADASFDTGSNTYFAGTEATFDGWTFSSGSSTVRFGHFDKDDFPNDLNLSSGYSIVVNVDFDPASSFAIRSQDGSDFTLDSLRINTLASSSQTASISLYRGTVQVGSSENVDFATSKTTGNVRYVLEQNAAMSATGGNVGTLSVLASLGDIDEVRLVFGGDASFVVDDIDITAAAVGPALSSATYDASTNVLSVTGTGMTAGDIIAVNKLTLTGEGGAAYTLTSNNVTATSATTFSVTLNSTDQLNVEGLLNKAGTVSVGGTTFNLAGAANWDASRTTSADATNAVTVSNVQTPTITNAVYNASNGMLAVTGLNLVKASGANNDITANKFTLSGDGVSYTLTDTSNVELTDASTFILMLSPTDKAAVNLRLNKNGVVSLGGVTYSLAAADDWNTTITGGDISDGTGNTITVSAVPNAAPVNTVPGAQTVAENGSRVFSSANGNAISVADSDSAIVTTTLTATNGTVTVTTDDGATVTNNGGATVTIAGTVVQVNAALAGVSYAPTSNYVGSASLQVSTTDGVASDTDTISISVTDVNPAITSPSWTFSVDENAPAGTVVGTVTASGDPNGRIWMLGGGGLFTIDNNGVITVASGASLDYEGTASYTMPVSVDDEDADTDADSAATVTINVLNVNEAPTAVALSNDALNQSAATASATVGTLTTTDPDAGGSFTYAIVGGTGLGMFEVSGSTLQVGPSALAAGSYEVVVRSTDQGGLSTEQTFTITVADDVAPTVASVSRLSTNVAGLTSVKGDLEYEVTFSEPVSNVDASDFTVDGTTATVTDASWISGNSYRVTVSGGNLDFMDGDVTLGLAAGHGITDTAGNALTTWYSGATLVYHVRNNEAPANTVPGTQGVDENATLVFSSANGNAIQVGDSNSAATLTTTLTATGGTVSVTAGGGAGITGDGSATVTITGSADQINAALASVSYTPDSNTSGTATLQVQTVDESGADDTDTITINVADVKPAITAGQVFAVDENSGGGTAVGTVAATGDANGRSWSITGGTGAGLFEIDASSGAITVKSGAELNFEGTGSYTLTVAVDDEDDGIDADATGTVTINLVNVNEAPTALALSNAALGTSASVAGATVGTFSTTDPDAVSSFTYALATGDGVNDADNGKFSISGDTLRVDTGALPVGSYRILVSSTDQGGLSTTQAFTVTVTDDVAPTLDAAASTPLDGATGVAVADDLVLQFSETVAAGSGFIRIVNPGDAGDTRVIDVSDTSQVTISGSSVTLNPTADLRGGTHYHVLIDAGALVDGAGNASVAVGSSTVLDFTTTNTRPTSSDDRVTTSGTTAVTLYASDFGSFSDADGNALAFVRIVNVVQPASAGTLEYDGSPVAAGQEISAADIVAGKLRYVPAVANTSASVQFQVSDGIDYSSAVYTLRFGPGNTGTVASAVNSLKFFQIETNPGLELSNLSAATVPSDLAMPRGVQMPLGAVGFTISGVTPGGSATVTVTVDSGLLSKGYAKVNPITGQLVSMGGTTTTVGNQTRITFTLVDGGLYDADRTANGVIVDPGYVTQDLSAPQVLENSTFVTSLSQVMNLDGMRGGISYALSGGAADNALFTVDPNTGELRFLQAPDYENPLDAGGTAGDNVYVLQVTATGTGGGSSVLDLAVQVIDDEGLPTLGLQYLAGDVTELQPDAPGYIDSDLTDLTVFGDGAGDALTEFSNGYVLVQQLEGTADGDFLADASLDFKSGMDYGSADDEFAAGETVYVLGVGIGTVDGLLDGQDGRDLRINLFESLQDTVTGLPLPGSPMVAMYPAQAMQLLRYTIPTLVRDEHVFGITLNDGENTYERITASFTGAHLDAPVIDGISLDSGRSDSDGITTERLPTLRGTAPADSTVWLYLDGVQVDVLVADANGDWSWTYGGAPLDDGTYLFTAKAVDFALGTVSKASAAYAVIVDNADPAGAADSAALSSDTGPDGTDLVTNTASQSISGTLTAALADGEKVLVSLDGGANWDEATVDAGGQAWTLDNATLTGSGTLKVKVVDAAGNEGAEFERDYVLDTTAPAITAVSVPAAGCYVAGDTLSFTVSFSEKVELGTGAKLVLDIGGATREASYVSGSGTTEAVFAYTVADGDLDAGGIDVASFDAGTGAQDEAGNAPDTTLNGVGDTLDVRVDAVAPDAPTLQTTLTNSATPVLRGQAEAGSSVRVEIGGAVYTTLADGSGEWVVDTASDAHTGTLDLGADGDKAVTLTSTDAAGNATGGSGTFTLDTTAPTVLSIERQTANDGGYTNAASLVWRVTFDGPVSNVSVDDFVVTGTTAAVTSVVSAGGNAWDVTVSGGNLATLAGSTVTLSFASTGDGRDIEDDAGNALDPTVTGTNDDAYVVDHQAPDLAAIDTPASGTYVAGQTLSFTLRLDEPVHVGADALLTLSLDGGTRQAAYTGGSGLSDVLVFEYVVQDGDAEADGIVVQSVDFGSAAKAGQDQAGNAAVIDAGWLPWDTDVRVDTAAPAIVSVEALPSAGHGGHYVAGDVITLEVGFDEDVAVAGTPTIEATFQSGSGAAVTRTFEYASTSGSTVSFTYTVAAGDEDLDGIALDGAIVLGSGGSIQDVAGNAAVLALGGVSTGGVLVDAVAPVAPTLTPVALTNDTTPVLSGTAEAGSTVRVSVGGATYEVTADASGTWTVDTGSATPVDGALDLSSDGLKAVALSSTDAAGNSSTGAGSFTLDATAPAAPTLTSAALTNDTTPVLSGTAEAGSTVRVSVGGATYEVTADAGGTWTVDTGSTTPAEGALDLGGDGLKAVALSSTDAAGNSSTGAGSFTLDTTA
ncbi:DUF4347 domain-containing protein, partial [uncultured Azohydromonas sp.]|uniref:DUF4347 domain-containing protein n=1 Tax=uncultured Azohydromonas sp. TaxID=487342 RepID=UPI00262E5EBE